ncbi:MAG: hypothetical protein Q8O37_16950 [Sulfuricellaceae bacterium]|nr:hypothetical protein [Sulfuricellaceae bacterium]
MNHMNQMILASLLLLPSLVVADNFPPPPGEAGRGGVRMRQDIQSYSGENTPDREALQRRREAFQKKAEERFRKSDQDGNGQLSRAEVQQNNPRMAKNFERIDQDKNGELSQQEIKQAFQQRMQKQQQQKPMGERP